VVVDTSSIKWLGRIQLTVPDIFFNYFKFLLWELNFKETMSISVNSLFQSFAFENLSSIHEINFTFFMDEIRIFSNFLNKRLGFYWPESAHELQETVQMLKMNGFIKIDTNLINHLNWNSFQFIFQSFLIDKSLQGMQG
jgi:hypothetical protein